jgi:hypothetical protein
MADHLANQAMDAMRSAQDTFPSIHSQLTSVREWLHNDFDYWTETFQEAELRQLTE